MVNNVTGFPQVPAQKRRARDLASRNLAVILFGDFTI